MSFWFKKYKPLIYNQGELRTGKPSDTLEGNYRSLGRYNLILLDILELIKSKKGL